MIRKTSLIALILFVILLVMAPIQAEDNNNATLESDDAPAGIYSDLNDEIQNASDNSVIDLDKNYRYTSASDKHLSSGVTISKNINLTGRGNACIDGNGTARGLVIDSNCRVSIENITFKNGYSQDNGGAILLRSNSTLILKNCVFENNKVYNSNGGAISTGKSTDIEIHNSVFDNNTSIRVSDLEWKSFKTGMGGAISVNIGSSLKLYDSVFKNNNAYLTTILLVSYDDVNYKLSSLHIDGCLFENNTSQGYGVIYLDEFGKGEILNSVFKNNVAVKSGGTVVLDASIQALIKNCLFVANSAIKGGAINIKMFNNSLASNVSVIGCNFSRNKALELGGAIYSFSEILEVANSTFSENSAGSHGAAIYSRGGRLEISDSSFNGNSVSSNGGAIYSDQKLLNITNSAFNNNSAKYGGAIFLKSNNTIVDGMLISNNVALVKGGGIYSKMQSVSSTGSVFINNLAPSGSDVYGVFIGQVTQMSSYYEDLTISLKLTSPWKMPLSQKVSLKLSGDKGYRSEWMMSDSRGVLNFKVPKILDAGKYSLTVYMESGVYYVNPTSINVMKAPGVVKASKLVTTFKSGRMFKVKIINSKTGKALSNVKLKIEVYTGKSHKTYVIISDADGVIRFSTSQLSVGKHKIRISSDDKNILLSKKSSMIVIKKGSAKIESPKTVKKPLKLRVIIKNKIGQPLKKKKLNVTITSRDYSYNVVLKTNSKGIFKINTKKLSRGKHKMLVRFNNKNYKIRCKFSVKIK